MTKDTKIICIGSACKDMFFPTDEGQIINTPEDITAQQKIAFELGAKYKIEERYESLGGCAANVACGLARLGINVTCYSHIGDDDISRWIISTLEKNSVEVSLITQEADCSSDLSAIIVDRKSADRVIFSNQKANAKLEISPENLENTEWIFIGDLHGDWEGKLDIITKTAKEKNIRIAYNPRQSNIHDNPKKIAEIISFSEILFLNKDESIEIISSYNKDASLEELQEEKFLLENLKNLGPKVVIVTDGVRGAWVYDGTEIIHTPGVQVMAVDSTGAGDSFCSGFLGAYLKSKNLEECAQWGIANSSHEVQFYGSIEGLLSEEEIAKEVTV